MSTDKVVAFPGITKLDIPAKRILRKAIKEKVTEVVICGYDEDGEMFIASSIASGPEIMWLLEVGKMRLLEAFKELGGE
jgi:hypothetical protein